jgi:hypothetical protein
MKWVTNHVKERSVAVLIGVLVVSFAVAWVALMSHPKVQYAPMAAFCRPLYAAARNHIDTMKVDAFVPPDGNRSESDKPLRCGQLRDARLLDDSTRS